MAVPVDHGQTKWFQSVEPAVADVPAVYSISEMNRHIATLKEQQRSQHLAKYQGVQEMTVGSRGTRLYQEDDPNQYIACDAFSKLKYDDLRKVHRDQTVFAVSEVDLSQRSVYASTEDLRQARETHIEPTADASDELAAREHYWIL
jgi:hypothetical protein